MTATVVEPVGAAVALLPQPARLRCDVFESLESTGVTPAEWDRFVASQRGDIYFSYEWLSTWWRFYGKGRARRVLVFWADEQIVGIVPLMVGRIWVGPVAVRVAKLLGADSTIVVLNPPVRSEYAEEVYRRTISYALQDERCDVLSLAPLSGEAGAARHAEAACAALGGEVSLLSSREIGVHTVFHLPSSSDAYFAGLSKSERGNYRRDERRFQEEHTLEFRSIQRREELEREFEQFVEMHRLQWAQMGKLGHFRDWPSSKAFAHELVQRLAAVGGVQLDKFSAVDQPIVYEFDYVFGDTHYWRLTSRVAGEQWERRGVGRIAFVRRLLARIERGVKRIEGGPGHYDYKLRLGATEYQLESVVIASSRTLARFRAWLLLRWSEFLNLAYYRFWFQRVAPRLPALARRPLWKHWIRTRL